MPGSDVGSVLPLALFVIGLLLAALGVETRRRDRRRREEWVTYPGRVVASRLEDGQFRSCVAYQRDGREVVFWNRFSATALTDPVGREVEVLVNPDDPDDAVVGRGAVNGSSVAAALVIGGALVASVGGYLLS